VVLNPLGRFGVKAHVQDAGQKPSQRNGEIMKIGDLVIFESDVPESQRFWTGEYVKTGIVVSEPSGDSNGAAVSVLWASGELTERCPLWMLEVR
jgi:hypothetical protein